MTLAVLMSLLREQIRLSWEVKGGGLCRVFVSARAFHVKII